MTPVLEPETTGELPPPDPTARPYGIDPSDQPPVGGPSDTTPSATSPEPRSGWHIAALVAGIVLLLPGLGALFGGTALLVAQGAATDEGFFDVTLDRIESDGVAVTSIDMWDMADDPDDPWVLDWLDVDVRLVVEGAGATDEVFVGIARTEDVVAYLDGAAHTEVREFEGRRPEYVHVAGATSIAAPTDVDIWDASAVGDDEQTLTWEARGGDWSVVVMNADGAAGVAADVEVGVRSGAITPIAIVMIVFGVIVAAGATTLVVIGARGRRD